MAPAFEVSWADVLCAECAQDILAHGWGPRHQPLQRGETSCTACAGNLARYWRESEGAGFTIAHWSLTVPEGMSRWRSAQHEAAHAVLGEHNGLITTTAEVEQSTATVAGVERPLGGRVNSDLPEGGVPLSSVANALHAGWAIDRLWLKSKGLEGDTAAQLDAACSAVADMVAIDQFAPAPDVHLQAIRDTDAQVQEYRGEITAVQEELLRSSHLSGDDVRQAMQRVRETDKARAIAKRTTHQPSPATDHGPTSTAQLPAAVAGGTSTTNTGGNAMSLIDQARESLGQADEKATYIRGALAQAALDAEDNVALLSQVSQESQTATEITNAYQQVIEQVQQALQLVQHATDLTESYALSLHS